MDDLPDYALAEAAVPRRVWFVECLEQSTLLISMEDDDSGDVDITPPIAHKARCLSMGSAVAQAGGAAAGILDAVVDAVGGGNALHAKNVGAAKPARVVMLCSRATKRRAPSRA